MADGLSPRDLIDDGRIEDRAPELAAALGRLDERRLADLFGAVAATAHGVWALVELRHELMGRRGVDPTLAPVLVSLRTMLERCFRPAELDFRAIGPDADDELLDHLADYEAVHPVRSREDLIRRLHPVDRRAFALFHPDLGQDPLAFVEVALTAGLEPSVQAVIDAPPPSAPVETDTATFYSITNCQPGLRGIPFGADLLHRAMDALAHSPGVHRFATLSPIPGFARWLGPKPRTTDALLAACARYLLTAKRDDRPLDPVARFHLENGARLERLNPGGDTSPRGRARHHGITANYGYDRAELAANQAAYRCGRIVASDAVTALVGPT